MIREFIKDWVKYLPSQLTPALAGLIAIPIITRLFAPQDYGNYVLVMATVSVLITISGWQDSAIIRFYPAYERDANLRKFYGTVIRCLVISVSMATVIFLGAIFATHGLMSIQLYHLMLLGALVFILRAGFQPLLAFLRAKRRVGRYTSLFSWYYIGSFGIGLTMVICLGFGIEGLLWGYIISLAVMLPFLWQPLFSKISGRMGYSTVLVKELARYGLPLAAGRLATWILSLADRYIIEFFRGSYEVGLYSASYMVSEKSILLISTMFLFVSGPIAMDVWEKKGVVYSQKFSTSITRYYLLVCLPAVVGLSILAKPIISIFTAPEYHHGFRIVPLIAAGVFFLGLQYCFHTGLLFYKKTSVIMTGIIVASLINVLLNILLVPRYGYMAAAAATLISYIFLFVAIVLASRKYFVWDFPFRSLGKIALASTIMGVLVYVLINNLNFAHILNLFVIVPLGIIIYSLTLFLLKEIQPGEKKALLELYKTYISGGKA